MSGMHSHDGYEVHSHEVRDDHRGVNRAVNDRQPVIRIALPGIPEQCGACGAAADEWPLSVYGNVVQVTCPNCWSIVAPVRAIASVPGA